MPTSSPVTVLPDEDVAVRTPGTAPERYDDGAPEASVDEVDVW